MSSKGWSYQGSSQPPELEASRAITGKSGIRVTKDDLVGVLVGLGLASSIISFLVAWGTLEPTRLLLEVLPGLMMLAVLLEVMPVQTRARERIMNFWRACMHRRGGSLLKWGPPHEWVLDSGAWNHHTSNLELLLEGGDFQEKDNKDASSSGDDVQGRWSVRTDYFDFPGIHYIVGDDTRNVVSVSQLARDHGLVTVFEPTSCHVKDKKTGQIVGKGHLRNGMYMLDYLCIIGQYTGDGSGASRGDRRDGADGGGGGQGLSQFDCILCIVSIMCIAPCILPSYTSWRAGVTILAVDFISVAAGLWVVLFIFSYLFKPWMMQSTICKLKQIGSLFRGRSGDKKDKEERTSEDYVQESFQQHNRQLFGLSRFDGTTDPTGYWRRQLPARAFPLSPNTARREEFLLDSGASFHVTWRKSILFPYDQHLQDHTKPPTQCFEGIFGSIEVTESGYLNNDKIMLDGVLLAPESRMNLVSVGQLSTQYGVQVEMDDEGLVIKKEEDGVRIGGGKMLNNYQYVLDYFQPPGGLFSHGGFSTSTTPQHSPNFKSHADLTMSSKGWSYKGASSQPPELEASQAITARWGIRVTWDDTVPRLVLMGLLGLGLGLGLGLWPVPSMFPLFQSEVLVMLQPVLVVLPVLVLVAMLLPVHTRGRFMNFWRACMHRSSGSLVKRGPPHEWVLESGAWNHHTSNLELLLEGGDFQSFQEMDNKDASSSGDDVVQGRGSVRTDCFDFPGVHYVVGDDDTRNVVSVSQLARDHGLVTVFEPTSCHVKNKKTGKIVGKGHLRNGMYILDSLRIVGKDIGDGGASGGNHRDGVDGGGGGRGQKGRGNNGDGDSMSEGHGGGGRDGRGGGGTEAGNQEEGSGSRAAGDVNEINEEGGDENDIEEMNENDEDDIKEIGEINGKGEKEDDEKRGGQNFGQLSSRPYTGLFRLSLFDCIWWIVSILCIAACILLRYTGWGTRVTILAVDFWLLFIWSYEWMSTICKETLGPYLQELSHQEQNKRLFGLSRFDATTDPTGRLPARAFASSTNAAHRPEHFFFDSGASYHTTWKESILFPYPPHLQNHTKPPTRSLGGIAAGSIAVTRSGYLNGDKIMLDGVLLAPEAQANLVSPGQLMRQYDVISEFDAEGFVIKKKWMWVQVVVGGGKMLDDSHLYVLQYFVPPGGLFAHLHPPHTKIFGKIRPGPA